MRKNIFSFLSIIILIILNSNTLFAQTDSTKSPISVGCDLMSRYVWRGTDFGGTPSIQPSISFEKSGFTIGAWGAYSTNFSGNNTGDIYKEADIFVGYTFKKIITLTVTDYFFPNDISDNKYFDYNNKTTNHVLETSLSFNGTEKLPLTVLLATNVYGADAKKINDDGTVGNIQFSTYAELGYSFKNLDVFIGTNMTQPDREKGESGYYGDYMGVVNLGVTSSKEIKITKTYSLPLTVSFIINPQSEKIFLVAGFSF